MSLNIELLHQSVIGEQFPIHTPFGVKPLIYTDYTASGRSIDFIEEFIRTKVLPFYGNTHTETSLTGRQTTLLREQSRSIIRQSVNATSKHHVIFTGSGATSAINRFIHLLNIPDQYNKNPVVFIGPYEHHSNDLPWRETDVILVRIPLNANGSLDLEVLENKLKKYQAHDLKIGCFSAASNVTGIITDVRGTTALLKQYKALSCWDYAAAAPYIKIDLHDIPMDAIFISPHKFLGGPGTPGLLIINDDCIKHQIPGLNGGGTVSYVTEKIHEYVDDVERREEGGTPAIIESIRAGLVFKLQQDIGFKYINSKEERLVTTAIRHWKKHKNINILGDTNISRLAIISFNINSLHHNLVVSMLNDLFGIQARGGCSCAGPYAHLLLNISDQESENIKQQLAQGNTLIRPGWVRLNLHYLLSDVLFDYIVTAVELIASYGYSLADQYHYNEDKGVWLYQNKQEELPVSLFDNEPFKYKNDDQAESLSLAMKKAQAVFFSSVSDSLVRAAYTAI